MSRISTATACLTVLALLAITASVPQAAWGHPDDCNGFVQINYVGGPMPAVPGDTVRVRLTLFTGAIDGGVANQLSITKVRFDLDCSAEFALGLPCTDDGAVLRYERNITSTRCNDASNNPVTFTDNSAPGNLSPNEVVFTPSLPIALNANTPAASGCQIEFDVQVASYSNDSTPYDIEEATGYRTVGGVPDAICDNGLSSTVSQSPSISLVPPTPTPTNAAGGNHVAN